MKTPVAEAVRVLCKGDDERLCPSNDEWRYREYDYILKEKRDRVRVAFHSYACSWCPREIASGTLYERSVHVSQPPVLIEGRCRRLWVERRHYPECPDRMREIEEEMERAWERHNAERKAAERKAA